jgi:hypothetical protein
MAIPLAGTRYAGLSPLELQKLLSDAEYEDYIESGTLPKTFAQTSSEGDQKVETSTQASFLSKGRGNVLGYQTGGLPTIKYEGPAEDIKPMLSTPEPEPEPETPKSLSEMSAQDIFKDFSMYDQGEQGLFGGKDVDYLRKQGVGDSTIREVAALSSVNQQTPAAVYQRLGGTLTSPESKASGPDPQQYARDYFSGQSDVGEKGIFGGKDVDAMRSKGYTDEQIRSTAAAIRRGGQKIPDAVFRRLGNF